MKKASYALNILFTVFFFWYFFIHVGASYYLHRFIQKKEFFREEAYYREKVKSYGKLNALLDNKKKYIVIVGDSIIEQFPTDELFDNYHILNRGIGKDTSQGVLDRVDININNINISSCFVMIGHNDLKYRSADATLENIKNILKKIRSDKVFFLSILPDKDYQSNMIVADINNALKKFCLNESCEFINFYEMFTNDDYVFKDQYFYDGVHITLDGYKAMAESLEAFLDDSGSL